MIKKKGGLGRGLDALLGAGAAGRAGWRRAGCNRARRRGIKRPGG